VSSSHRGSDYAIAGDMTTADNTEGTTRKLESTLEKMFNATGESVSDLATSYNEKDGEDKEDVEEDSELGKLSEDEPGWVMGTISKKVQHHVESCRPKQMRVDELSQQG
jgi:phosphate uptake regulator